MVQDNIIIDCFLQHQPETDSRQFMGDTEELPDRIAIVERAHHQNSEGCSEMGEFKAECFLEPGRGGGSLICFGTLLFHIASFDKISIARSVPTEYPVDCQNKMEKWKRWLVRQWEGFSIFRNLTISYYQKNP
jgi:hypothetical protein